MAGEEQGSKGLVNISRCHRLVELECERLSLEKKLKETKREISALWEPILDELTRCGLRSVPLENGASLRAQRQIFCNKAAGVDPRVAAEALIKAGLDWCVDTSYSPSKLKDYVREKEESMVESGEMPEDLRTLLPAELRSLFNVGEVNKVVVYGAKALLRKYGREKRTESEEQSSVEN